MTEDHKKQLESQLWNIANTLRGKMGADEFRDYILGFIFFKYLSERMRMFADEILKNDGITFGQIDEASTDGKAMLEAIQENSVERLGYFLKPSELFHKVAEKGSQKTDNFILEDLDVILKHIESSTMGHDSEEDFEGLFEDLDLGSSKLGKSENQKNELIARVLTHLDQIDFQLDDTEADVLGDAYEYLIGQFASGAGKKAGEFYTPQEVSTILAKIVTTGKTSLKNVYDPTCGSGSLLLRVAKEVEEVGGFYGQEMNPTTYNLARMNMILHGIHYQRFDLKNEDTLEHPAPEHADMRFDAIVANPPFSAKWSANAIHENDERFSAYGKLAPKTKADFAFVQHMIHHLDTNATMAVVLPHGVLFRGAAEGHIRKYLIEDCNWIDAVIGLPANIFYGTSIPTCILVLKKQRENPNDILFIDASGDEYFEKVGNQNALRPEDIERIVSAYRKRESIEKFSHVAELSEIEENDYNLNIPRYVDTFEEEEPVDLAEVSEKLVALEKDMGETDKVIAGFCEELRIPSPAGHNAPLLRDYKKGVMQQLFTQAIRFKDDNGNDFPDWEEKKLGEIGSFLKGKGISKTEIDEDGATPCIRYGELYTDYSEVIHEPISKTNLPTDELVISKANDVIIPASGETHIDIATASCVTKKGIALGGDLNIVRTNLDGVFLAYYLNNACKHAIARVAQGSSVIHLYSDQLKGLSLTFPDLPEQTKIADFLSAIDRKIESVTTQITET